MQNSNYQYSISQLESVSKLRNNESYCFNVRLNIVEQNCSKIELQTSILPGLSTKTQLKFHSNFSKVAQTFHQVPILLMHCRL